MAMRFQRKAAGRCKGVRELQERGVPFFSVGRGAFLAAGWWCFSGGHFF